MEQNKNQQQQFECTGDCLKCSPVQRQYCASQKSYDNQRILIEMQESLKAMSGTVEELKAKIAAIQDSEAMVFDPNAEKLTLPAVAPTPIAQEGDGA